MSLPSDLTCCAGRYGPRTDPFRRNMSHTHFCDIAGHPWQCESRECTCICQKPMEQGDHSHCSIELRACPEHSNEQSSIVDREQDTSSELHEADASGPPTRSEERRVRKE